MHPETATKTNFVYITQIQIEKCEAEKKYMCVRLSTHIQECINYYFTNIHIRMYICVLCIQHCVSVCHSAFAFYRHDGIVRQQAQSNEHFVCVCVRECHPSFCCCHCNCSRRARSIAIHFSRIERLIIYTRIEYSHTIHHTPYHVNTHTHLHALTHTHVRMHALEHRHTKIQIHTNTCTNTLTAKSVGNKKTKPDSQ